MNLWSLVPSKHPQTIQPTRLFSFCHHFKDTIVCKGAVPRRKPFATGIQQLAVVPKSHSRHSKFPRFPRLPSHKNTKLTTDTPVRLRSKAVSQCGLNGMWLVCSPPLNILFF